MGERTEFKSVCDCCDFIPTDRKGTYFSERDNRDISFAELAASPDTLFIKNNLSFKLKDNRVYFGIEMTPRTICSLDTYLEQQVIIKLISRYTVPCALEVIPSAPSFVFQFSTDAKEEYFIQACKLAEEYTKIILSNSFNNARKEAFKEERKRIDELLKSINVQG